MSEILESVSFTVLGPPRAKERARVTSRGTFTPRRTREYEQAVADQGAWHCGAHWSLDGAYRVLVTFVFADRRRRDIDNCLKAVLDALNGIAWDDDSQVATVRCSKLVGEAPRTEIIVERLAVELTAPRRRRVAVSRRAPR